ncbi:MAG: fused MFS/spermidine synthase [Bryobacterales bacterium]|nr:fused MFS/spermidine synthase [Bryobacterales bacterium]
MSQNGSRMGRLEIIAFLSGAAVMVLEITGSRVMAPFLGTSIFVWTTLIGVIMASLSAGYWWGGRLADRNPTFERLAAILFLACLGVTVTAISQHTFLAWLQELPLELRVSALAATLFLFAPASALLGMVTPYVVRLKLRSIESSGAEVGRLYAISTAGSILGTFACGYFLLSWMGSSRILYGIAFLLLALSFVAVSELWAGQRVAAAVFLLLTGGFAEFEAKSQAAAGFHDIDTDYQRLQVIDAKEPEHGRPVRILKSEEANTQSAIYLDGDGLYSDYLHYFDLTRYTGRPLRRVLMIGAAGYVYPMHLSREAPGISIDVVEIDPAMTGIARQYFGLRDSRGLRIFHEDGRTFVNRAARQAPGSYDAIFLDAFQTRVPPFQLLTVEFVRNLERLLSPRGIVALNFIARADTSMRGLSPAVVRTYSEALPAVQVFAVHPDQENGAIQNLVLFASRTPIVFQKEAVIDGTRLATALRSELSRARGLPLTDDFAPVEYLVSGR